MIKFINGANVREEPNVCSQWGYKGMDEYVKSYRRRGGTSYDQMRNFIRDGIYWQRR